MILGQDDYDRIRPLSYPNTDIFLLCFSLVRRITLQNVHAKWLPEARHYSPETPFILVGTKFDLRNQSNEKVTTIEGQKEAKKMGKQCQKYMECSALTQDGLKEVFHQAIIIVLSPKKQKIEKPKCKVLWVKFWKPISDSICKHFQFGRPKKRTSKFLKSANPPPPLPPARSRFFEKVLFAKKAKHRKNNM